MDDQLRRARGVHWSIDTPAGTPLVGSDAMSSASAGIVSERHALVLCDLQPDLLGSIPTHDRERLLDTVRIVLTAARRAKWLVVFTGLRFGPGYAGISPRHKLYGGLARLNAKVGDERAHWFLEGFEGSEIATGLLELELGDHVVWRQQHMPARALLDVLHSHGTTKATIVGAKAGYSVQATAQVLTSEGLLVSVVRDCVVDDKPERCSAVLEHLLPVFADVVSLADAIDDILGMDVYADEQRANSPVAVVESHLLTDCGRGGHMSRYARFLLDRPGWKTYPTQKWYLLHSMLL